MSNVTEVLFGDVDRQRSPDAPGRAERAAAIAAMGEHPAMPEAMRVFFTGLVGVAQVNRLLGLIVSDRNRMILTALTLYLDAGYDGRDPLSGLTVNRFKALCARAGRSSPGRASALLGLMRFAGYLEPATRTARGQPLRLVPTEKLIAPQRTRTRCLLAALAKLRSEGAIGLARLDDPEFFRILTRCFGEQILAREPMIEHGPGLAIFAERKAGLMMMMHLMLSARPDDDLPPVGPIPVSAKQLARRLGVARSQVQEMLRAGVAAGLLAPAGPDEAAYVLQPPLRAGAVGFVGAIFLLTADAVTQAQAECDAGPQRIGGVA